MQLPSLPRPTASPSSNSTGAIWDFYQNIDLLLVLIIYWSTYIVCQGAVSFVSQPRNQTVKEGDSIRFECSYQGSYLTPAWRINKTIYSHTELPHIFLFNDQNFSLTVSSVPSSLNFTSFECIVGTVFSNRGYLYVEVDRENNTIECAKYSTESSTKVISDAGRLPSTTSFSEWRTSDLNSTTAASPLPPTVNNDVSVLRLTSVTVIVSISLLLCMCIHALGIGACWMLRKTKAVSEVCQHDVEVGDNEAYAAVEKYRKPIKLDNNPAYETISNLSSEHQRCKSPQA